MDIDAGSTSPVNRPTTAKPTDEKYSTGATRIGDSSTGPVGPSATGNGASSTTPISSGLTSVESKAPSANGFRPIPTPHIGGFPVVGVLPPKGFTAQALKSVGHTPVTGNHSTKRTASEALLRPSLIRQPIPSGTALSGVSVSKQLGPQADSSNQPAGSSLTPASSSSSTSSSLPSSASAVSQQPAEQSSSKASEDSKASKWLATMRGHLAAGTPVFAREAHDRARFGGVDTVMVDAPTRSGPGPRAASRDASHSDGEADSDAESTGSALGSTDELVSVLRVIADISAFNAECLAKLSGIPMPDFDDAADQ